MAVEIFTEEGTVEKYRLLSERLPEFLEAFPVSEGYRIVVDAKALTDLCPGLEVGGIIFTASLFKGELVVANASAHRFRLANYKDWEKGETAARQRLLAACGFGGHVLDEDEVSDMEDQGREITCPAPPAATTERKVPSQVEAKAETKAPDPQKAPAKQQTKPVPQQLQPATSSEIPDAMMRQVLHQATIRGVEVPSLNSMDDARTFLKSLMQKAA